MQSTTTDSQSTRSPAFGAVRRAPQHNPVRVSASIVSNSAMIDQCGCRVF